MTVHHKVYKIYWYPVFLCFILTGCKKLVGIPPPINTVTTAQAFSSISKAQSAVTGIYYDMSYGNNNISYACGATTLNLGMAADELNPFGGISRYQSNTLESTDYGIYSQFWAAPYYDIYLCNAAIEGLQASSNLPAATSSQLTGEAKFLRAFIYFYLVNYFGDVPLVTSTSWAANSLLGRTPVATVYDQIEEDLKSAQTLLPGDYTAYGGEKTRATSRAATALLARAYLYQQKWDSAETQASQIIDNAHLYSLLSNPDSVFLKNSQEAILQLQSTTTSNYAYATQEGYIFVTPDQTSEPNYYLTNGLLTAFEPGDLRRTTWVDSTNVSGQYYYYPYKYKVRTTTSDNITEYYMVLRLAEQFLIRAEARAQQQGETAGAISDLNQVRQRAKLPDLSSTLTQTQVLLAVEQERRIELFAEWGHRWLDLKRTNRALPVLTAEGKTLTSQALLFPLPLMELQTDPNLAQNAGY